MKQILSLLFFYGGLLRRRRRARGGACWWLGKGLAANSDLDLGVRVEVQLHAIDAVLQVLRRDDLRGRRRAHWLAVVAQAHLEAELRVGPGLGIVAAVVHRELPPLQRVDAAQTLHLLGHTHLGVARRDPHLQRLRGQRQLAHQRLRVLEHQPLLRHHRQRGVVAAARLGHRLAYEPELLVALSAHVAVHHVRPVLRVLQALEQLEVRVKRLLSLEDQVACRPLALHRRLLLGSSEPAAALLGRSEPLRHLHWAAVAARRCAAVATEVAGGHRPPSRDDHGQHHAPGRCAGGSEKYS
mmetsp:Transcript_61337/g.147728  ORF Transcript_61337/g.147728 Transcript_61337/m.147728 type:complete len:297 (+) Transcript_61337:56-946(+)